MSRINILTIKEIEEFESPPILNTKERKSVFEVEAFFRDNNIVLRKPTAKVVMTLMLGYFRHKCKIFSPKDFHVNDIQYVNYKHGLNIKIPEIRDYADQWGATSKIKEKILGAFSFTQFDVKNELFREEVRQLVAKRVGLKQLFYQICNWLILHKIEVPSYHALQVVIGEELNSFEETLINSIKEALTEDERWMLDDLLEPGLAEVENNENGLNSAKINRYKKTIHSLKPAKIKVGVEQFKEIKFYYEQFEYVLHRLRLPVLAISYYAKWAMKARVGQLDQFKDPNYRYLHLIAFICDQYFQRQDYLIDVLLLSIKSVKNAAENNDERDYYLNKKKHKEQKRFLYKVIEKAKQITRDRSWGADEKIARLDNLFFEHENNPKIKEIEEELEGADDASMYKKLENKYRVLKNRVSEIIKETIFSDESSDQKLFRAISFYKRPGFEYQTEPLEFLSSDEQQGLFDKNGRFNVYLYRILLYLNIWDSIKSGALNIRYSYKYLSVEDYLIDRKTWALDREEFLKIADLEMFSDPIAYLDDIKKIVGEQYNKTNQNVIDGSNKFIYFSVDGKPIVSTPSVEKPDLERVSSLFSEVHHTSLLSILSDIQNTTSFLDSFEHHKIKHVKKRPSPQAFFCAIIGLGCNIGVERMGNISNGVKFNTLNTTVNWYFSLDNINSANNKLLTYINTLPLAQVYKRNKGETHTSSDGQKYGTSVDSIHSTYSFKYFGKGRGVSVIQGIDERAGIFYSTVTSSTDREAATVIDGLLSNEVIQSDKHSTDTHGYTEITFALTEFLGIKFSPRIQNFKDQTLSGFDPIIKYKKLGYRIIHERYIDQQLIIDQWEDILRLAASLKLRYVTASQLFKRLNSYSKEHPLHKALKELGRIHKSHFLLEYMDDPNYRSAIQKQLNKSELSNKFKKALRFGNNQEFDQSSKDDQEISAACTMLIQNCTILWNYFYLSEMISTTEKKERPEKKAELLEIIENGSILTWQHVNFHGEYDFEKVDKNQKSFDLEDIMNLDLS